MVMLIQGGQVLTSSGAGLEPVDVLVEGSHIRAVGPRLTAPADAQVVDATERLVLPGLVNAHTHAHNALLRGLAGRWTLEDLLTHGAALNASRTVDEQYLSAALNAVEMVKTGCTAAYDLFMAAPAPTAEGIEAVVRAYTDVGLRATLAPAVADLVFFGTVPGLLELLPADLRAAVDAIQPAPTDGLLRLTEDAIRRWHGAAGGRIRMHVAPTIPGQCTDAFLAGCARLAREHGVGVHTHLAETKVQVVHAAERWGQTIVARLDDLGLLGPGFVGAHAIWLVEDDIRRLAEAGASVVHNPASNLRTGAGLAPVREMLVRGITVALGSDGSMASDNQNLFEVMRFAALAGTVRFPYDQASWLDGRTVWTMATAGGARALGLEGDIGVIAPGSRADLVLVRADSSFLRPLNCATNALVYAETGADVETVIIDGRLVVAEGRVTTVDESRLRARAAQAAADLRARNAEAWALAARLLPHVGVACRAAAARPCPVDRYAGPVAARPASQASA
jgi:5-methylthioadenosine/S-adenosylhomocysteine deaminase